MTVEQLLVKFIREDNIATIKTTDPDQLKACCPFHDDKNPSLSISISKGAYYCFACGAKGGAKDWLLNHRGLSEQQAKDQIKQALPPAPKAPNNKVLSELPTSAVAHHYYRARGKIIGCVCRFDDPKRKCIPYKRVKDGWVKGALDKPRVLYNATSLKQSGQV